MIYVTGDIHGDFSRFEEKELKKLKEGDVLLICGDFGFLWDNNDVNDIPLPRIQESPDVDLIAPTVVDGQSVPAVAGISQIDQMADINMQQNPDILLASIANGGGPVPKEPKSLEPPEPTGPPANWDEDEAFLSDRERAKKEKREQKVREKLIKEEAILQAKKDKEARKRVGGANDSAAAQATEAINKTIVVAPPVEEKIEEIKGSLVDAMMGIVREEPEVVEEIAEHATLGDDEGFPDEEIPESVMPEEPPAEPEPEPIIPMTVSSSGTNFEDADFGPKVPMNKKKKVKNKKAVVAQFDPTAPANSSAESEQRVPRNQRSKKDIGWDEADFGQQWLEKLSKKKFDIAFVDGVYDNLNSISRYPETTWKGGKVNMLAHNVVHLKSGEIFRIQGRNILAIGGGTETTGNQCGRMSGIPTKEDVVTICNRLEQYSLEVDYIISHQAPSNVIGNLDNGIIAPKTMLTTLMDALQQKVTFKRWIFGSYHRNRVVTTQYQCLYDQIECLGGRKRVTGGKIVEVPCPEPTQITL